MSDQWAVQVAVMALLNADAQLPPVYDSVDTGTLLPYGQWGSPTSSRRGLLGVPTARRNSIIIDWWDKDKDTVNGNTVKYGNSRVAAYAKRTIAVLSDEIVITGGDIVLLKWQNDTYLPEPEANRRRVRQQFLIDTQ